MFTEKRALDDLCWEGLVIKEKRWRENGSLTSNLYQARQRKKQTPPAKGASAFALN